MSNQNTPGTGIHQEDLNAMTEYWHRETNYINDKVDEAFKSAQDDAYARGYRRGREDLIEIRKQRDELLAAFNKFMDSHEECTDFDGFTAQIVSMDDYHEAHKAIANVKGSAE